jgi:hypothetical protein
MMTSSIITQQNGIENYNPHLILNDIQYNSSQHNDIQYNNVQHNDIQHNNSHYNDIQHYNTQHDDILHNNMQNKRHISDIQHNNTMPNSEVMTTIMLGSVVLSVMASESLSKSITTTLP